MNKIIWRDIESTEIKGLMICELPPITKPKMRVQETQIDGVDGSIIEELGYESYDKTITIGLTKNFDIDEVIEYFTGEGNVTFSNEPERYYKAKIIDQIDYERLLRYKTATLKFRVQPFKYELDEIIEKKEFNNSPNLFDFSKWYENKDKFLITGGTFEITENSIFLDGTIANQYLYGNFSASTTATDEDKEIINTFGIVVEPNTQYSLVVNSTNYSEIWVMYYDSDYAYTTRTRLVIDSSGEKVFTFTTPETAKYICLRISNNAYATSDTTLILSDFRVLKGDYVPKEFRTINNGNTISKPIIKIEGTGTIELIVNGNKLFSYTFPEDENTVIIDSQKQDAYLGTILKNRNMSGEFPIFNKGNNIITWNGTIESIEVSLKSRWI